VPIPRLALIGLGWHARRLHGPWLRGAVAAGRARFVGLIDLADAEGPVRARLAELGLRPERCFFGGPNPGPALDALRAEPGLDGVLVAAAAGAHLEVLRAALSRGLRVVVDKPLTAPEGPRARALAQALRDDHAELTALERAAGGQLGVLLQRRSHPAWLAAKDLLDEVRDGHGAPLTALSISHADGMWVLPHEWNRTHHPYSHGAGKLLHSGVHFVDLMGWLLPAGPPGASLDLWVAEATAPDIDARTAGARAALPGPAAGPPVSPVHPGEVDLCALGRLRRGGAVEALIQLELLQGAVSWRASSAPAADPYKGAGRVRHERLSLHVGPLLHVALTHHPQDADELRSGDRPVELHICRSPLLAGPRVERRSYGPQGAWGPNEAARIALLDDFLAGGRGGSSLAEQARTVQLLAALVDARDRGRRGEAPTSVVHLSG